MLCVNSRARNFPWKNIYTEKRESNRIYNTALPLPVLAEDIVLTRQKFEVRRVKGSEVSQLEVSNDQKESPPG